MDTVSYKSYKFRPFQEGDKKTKLKLGLHKKIRKGYGADYRIVPTLTQEMVEVWYKKEKETGLWDIENFSEPIGHCGLINEFFRIGFWHPKFMNHGHGATIANIVLTYTFEYLNKQRVSPHVLDYNKIAIRSYQKAGFKFVRSLEEPVEIAGKFEQENLMEVIKENFTNSLEIKVL